MLILQEPGVAAGFCRRPKAKWLAKGLAAVFAGGREIWSAYADYRPLAPTGGPKSLPSKFGIAQGFGATYGTGTTDRLDGGALPRPSTGWRSVVSQYYANSTGGGGLGRIFQDASGTGLSAGETLWTQSNAINYGIYASSSSGAWFTPVSSLATGRWQSAGVTHDQRTVNVLPTMYLDGASVAVNISQTASGTYQTTPCNMVWGNRASDSARVWDGMLGPTLFFDGQLTAADHADLARDPLQVFEDDLGALYLPFASSGSAALAGNAAAQASASGTISVQVPIVGAATVVATASGTLTTQSPLAGSATVVATATGELSVTFALSGAALVNALAAGAISTSVALSGSALANALATGNLLAGGAGALAGNAAAQASASGSLSTAIPLQGAASALAVATGGLTTAFPLVGVAAAVSHVTGDLTVTFGGALSGNAVAQVLAAGALSIQVALSGSAVAHALATGILGSGDVPNTPQDTWDRALQALFEPFYGDFGEPAVVAGIPVVGMFSSRAQDSFGIVQPSAAVLRMSATHVAAVGDTVTVGARTYQIAAIHDLDGSGTEKTLELK